LGAYVYAIHCQPDGRNINRHAGALHLGALQREVLARRAELGIAFDGDADRAMFVDAEGAVRDGDDVLFLLARYAHDEDTPRTIVGTVMANLGLQVALEDLGFRLARTSVGDRYVLEEMLRLGATFGGEQSGHIIMTHLARTGDGLLTALKVLEIMEAQNHDLAALCRPVKRFPQVLVNVRVSEKVPFENIEGLRDTEEAYREKLGVRSRILLRYSGTERLARVMVEGEDESTVHEAAHQLAAYFK
jgi:phosphoglucosamine mutase